MVPEHKKRLVLRSNSSHRSKKRRKIEPEKNAKPQKKHLVAVDELPWNEVQMPQMFDDAEGFLGLEEVEGVEVIREGGAVQFVSTTAREPTYAEEDEFEGVGEDYDVRDLPREPTYGVLQAPRPLKEKKEREDKPKRTTISPKTPEKLPLPAEDVKGNAFKALDEEVAEEGTDVSAWKDLDLSSDTLSALSKLGFSAPTPIQAAAIPEILAGHDVIGKASTGSGKTLAFGIPILESWIEAYRDLEEEELKTIRPPRALILSPTRELAHQLTEHITKLCKGIPDIPYIATVTGGLSVQKQQRQLLKADIIIGTPGRLWEVMSSSTDLTNSFRHIKFLVVDEADRLLTEGHFKEAEEILNALDRQQDAEEDDQDHISTRQTLIFSATFAKGLQQKLAGKGKQGLMDGSDSMDYLLKKLNFKEDKPKFVDVNPASQMAAGLKEGVVECAGTEKDLYLYAVILYHPRQKTLIFANSIHSVRRLVPMLQNLDLPAHALHSQMAQKARMRSIERFSSPAATGSILVATDVAARGLDIGGVQLVIHYHLPRAADMYVHRSGRTARAEASGSSILLCAPEEVVPMRRLAAKVHVQNAVTGGQEMRSKYYMRSLDIDRKVVARLNPRLTLAKKIADSALAKEKKGHDDDWIKQAAEELGVDYDSEEFGAAGAGRKGRGTGRRIKEKEARGLTKAELGALRAKLRSLLVQRVNIGVSERYLTTGTLDIDELLKEAKGDFLGRVEGIGLDDL